MKNSAPTRNSKAIPVYCHILKCVVELKGDALAVNVAKMNNRKVRTAALILRQMTDLGVLRIAGEKTPVGGRVGLIFAIAGEPSAPIKTKSLDIVAGASLRARVELSVFCAAIKLLLAGKSTRQELADKTGYSRDAIKKITGILRSYGLLHVSGHKESEYGRVLELLAFGASKDAKRPPALSQVERSAIYEKKRKARRQAESALRKNPFSAPMDDEVCARRLVSAGKVHSIAGIVLAPRSIFDLAAA
jgi:hypothetical protein